jgi:hypothetical protein
MGEVLFGSDICQDCKYFKDIIINFSYSIYK